MPPKGLKALCRMSCARSRGQRLKEGQLALIRCSDDEGKANGEAIIQVLSAGNPYFPRVKFLACSVAEYDWYVSKPGAENQIPLNARIHLCKGYKDECEAGAGSLRELLVEHVDRWAGLKLTTAK